MESKHKKTESTNLFKNSILTIAGLAVLGAGLWALMHYSAPASNLQSYASYQESNNKPEKSAPQDTQKTAPKTDLGNLIKKKGTFQALM